VLSPEGESRDDLARFPAALNATGAATHLASAIFEMMDVNGRGSAKLIMNNSDASVLNPHCPQERKCAISAKTGWRKDPGTA